MASHASFRLLASSLLWAVLATSATVRIAFSQAVAPPAATDTEMLGLPSSDDGLPGAGPIRRAGWFRPIWNERRGAWADRGEADRGAVVFLGDSITQGWGDDFRHAFEGMKAANRGISGDTTRGMLVRLADDVIALDPRGVVMLMGTNDLDEGASPATIAGNVTLILSELKSHDPEMPIVLCAVFPSSAQRSRPAEKIRELNRLLAEIARENPQVTFVDTWTLFANESGDAKLAEFPDLLHPNEIGYRKWAAAVRPIFATHGFLETAPDEFQPEPGFELLFNGRNLTGWGSRPTPEADLKSRDNWRKADPNAPPWPVITEAKSFDGQTQSDSGRFVAKNGRLIVTTPHEGRKIEQLWTTREFPKDFTLKLEFRATPNADSGIYLRGPQLQCRDYVLAGPYSKLASYRPQDWNEIVIEVHDGTARCTCNGEVFEEKFALPSTGPIGFEGDRGQVEYRRIRVRLAQ
jgi:lysophospholipase L1-like esterase